MSSANPSFNEYDAVKSLQELFATFGILPEMIDVGTLDVFNSVLGSLVAALRHAAVLRADGKEREAACFTLNALSVFILRFQPGYYENLDAPLRDLASALVALDQGNVTALMKPKQTEVGGQAVDSPTRQVIVGFAVGTVGRLRWAGLRIGEAHKAVAEALRKIGIRPSRGSGELKPRTVREWCERIEADVAGDTIATLSARLLLTPGMKEMFGRMQPEFARTFALHAMTRNVREINGAASVHLDRHPPLGEQGGGSAARKAS